MAICAMETRGPWVTAELLSRVKCVHWHDDAIVSTLSPLQAPEQVPPLSTPCPGEGTPFQ